MINSIKKTVFYRISKAREMYMMDLSDADEREYIAASLRIYYTAPDAVLDI